VVHAQGKVALQYHRADVATRDSVASIVHIIDSVLCNTPLRNALFHPTNVAIRLFGGFVFTPIALVEFTALAMKRRATKPTAAAPNEEAPVMPLLCQVS